MADIPLAECVRAARHRGDGDVQGQRCHGATADQPRLEAVQAKPARGRPAGNRATHTRLVGSSTKCTS